MTTPSCGHPSDGGELGTFHRRTKFPSAEGWREAPGWFTRCLLLVTRYSYVCRSGALRPVRILVFVQTALSLVFTYSDSSRAKRGDPVNKKALRANARRHIALDCRSRTTTFSTLIVLLRNDRGRVYPNNVSPPNAIRPILTYLYSKITLIYTYIYIFLVNF